MRITDPAVLARYTTPHAHKHGLSRRELLKAGAVTTAVVASGMLGSRAVAASDGGTPKPVPADAAFGGLHIYGVGPKSENSSITDFTGIVGAAIVDGTGVAHDEKTGKSEKLLFDTDMRFMQGTFRGTDGLNHECTFAFV